MDKTMKRQIAYKKPGPAAFDGKKKEKSVPVVAKPPAKAKKSKPKAFKVPVEAAEAFSKMPWCASPATSKQVILWIKAHPYFKWSGMCIALGIHKGNFWTMMQSKEPYLKPEVLSKIEQVISQYGFTAESG